MQYQNHEKKFISKLETLANFKLLKEDTDMLIKIWRRHSGKKECFKIGSLLDTDIFEKDRNFIYIQNGKYYKNFSDLSDAKYFIILHSGNEETAIGLPIYSVYIYNPTN